MNPLPADHSALSLDVPGVVAGGSFAASPSNSAARCARPAVGLDTPRERLTEW